MKRISSIILWFLFVTVWMNGATVKGKITLQNSGGKPIRNAMISAFGANPQTSTRFGLFELSFPGKKPGDGVSLVVQKKGLDVVNKKTLKRVILRKNADELVEIVMCPEGSWEKNAYIYYVTITKAIHNEFDKRLRTIESENGAGKDAKARRLTEELNAALSNAKKMAEDFAQVNLDHVSDLYKESFGYFTQGDIDKALAVVNREKSGTGQQLAMDYILGARLFEMKVRPGEAESYFDKALEADPKNLDHYLEFSLFLSNQKCFQKQEGVCKKALALEMDEATRADFLNHLGTLYLYTVRLKEAEETYTEAKEIYRKLHASGVSGYLPDLAMIVNNLGGLYLNTLRLTEAEKAYNEALKIYRSLTLSPNSYGYLPDLAMVLNNLGTLYSNTRQLAEAERAYAEALEIYRKLAEINPSAHLQDVAMVLNSLGNLYYRSLRLSEAEKAYTEALENYRNLAKTNPSAYLPSLAVTLNNLGVLYKNTERLDEAEKMYAETLETYRNLASANPSEFSPGIALTLNNLGTLYSDTQRLAEAEKAYAEALETYRNLANVSTYLPDMAITLNNLGLLNLETKKYPEALPQFREALSIREKLTAANPKAFELSLCRTILCIVRLYGSSPGSCEAMKEEISVLLDRAMTILKTYPDNPRAQQYLDDAKHYKEKIR